MNKIRELFLRYREPIAYLFWGGMTTLVSWGTFSLFSLLFRPVTWEFSVFGLDVSAAILLANALSWICAVLFAYVTNKLWVFRSRSWAASVVWPEMLKFFSARAATGILEIIAVPLLTAAGLDQTIFGIEGLLAKIIVSIVVVILNYVFSKLFIFKKKTA